MPLCNRAQRHSLFVFLYGAIALQLYMFRHLFTAIFVFASLHVFAQELIPVGNGFYYANCYTQEQIDGLADTDSIQRLLLAYYGKDHKTYEEIRLKSPQYLTELVIWSGRSDPGKIRFKDSLVNLRSLSIEGAIRDSLSIKFDPEKITGLGLDLKRSGFSYLERFPNVDTLSVIYSGKDKKMFEVLAKLQHVSYMQILKRHGEITLDTSIHSMKLRTLSGNFSLTDRHVLILLQHTTLEKLAFEYVRYRYFPPLLTRLSKEKKVYVKSLKSISNTQLYYLQQEGVHLVHLGGRLWE